MRIVFQGDDNSQVVWNISMINDEENSAMKWLKDHKVHAEGLTTTVQVTRLLMKAFNQAK